MTAHTRITIAESARRALESAPAETPGRSAGLRRARGVPFWACSLLLHGAVMAVLAHVVWRYEKAEAPEVILALAVKAPPAPAPPVFFSAPKRNSVGMLPLPVEPPVKAPVRRVRPVKDIVPAVPRGTDVAAITADLAALAAIASLPPAPKAAPVEQAEPSIPPAPSVISAPAGAGEPVESTATIAVAGKSGARGGSAAVAPAPRSVAGAVVAGAAAGSGTGPSGGGPAHVYGVGEIDERPVRTRYIAPEFPSSARLRGLVGWVRLVFVVTAGGSVEDIAVAELHGTDDFAAAAREAAARWQFRPGRLDGRAVAVRCSVKITFRPPEA